MDHREFSSRGGKAARAKETPEQRKAWAKAAAAKRWASATAEERKAQGERMAAGRRKHRKP